jgi:hypothetical protein
VPQEIVNNVSEAEKRRQEAINEVIYTEKDFVRDMEYLRDVRSHLPHGFHNLYTIARLGSTESKKKMSYQVNDELTSSNKSFGTSTTLSLSTLAYETH